jgi:very-short-patch-repair endonuclease
VQERKGLIFHTNSPPAPLCFAKRDVPISSFFLYFYTKESDMSKSKYLDFKVIKKHARELRNDMTDSEKLLWKQLKNRQLSGHKFLRQHPIVYKADYKGLNYFIADFYCDERKTVIELDGPIHQNTKEYDQFRDIEMKRKGIHILRLKNDDLTNISEVLQKINCFLDSMT